MPGEALPPTDAELDVQLLAVLQTHGQTNISALVLQHIAGPVTHSRHWRRRVVDRLRELRVQGQTEYRAGAWRIAGGKRGP